MTQNSKAKAVDVDEEIDKVIGKSIYLDMLNKRFDRTYGIGCFRKAILRAIDINKTAGTEYCIKEAILYTIDNMTL